MYTKGKTCMLVLNFGLSFYQLTFFCMRSAKALRDCPFAQTRLSSGSSQRHKYQILWADSFEQVHLRKLTFCEGIVKRGNSHDLGRGLRCLKMGLR